VVPGHWPGLGKENDVVSIPRQAEDVAVFFVCSAAFRHTAARRVNQPPMRICSAKFLSIDIEGKISGAKVEIVLL
jgi:hypothetical protein